MSSPAFSPLDGGGDKGRWFPRDLREARRERDVREN